MKFIYRKKRRLQVKNSDITKDFNLKASPRYIKNSLGSIFNVLTFRQSYILKFDARCFFFLSQLSAVILLDTQYL